MDRQDLVFVVLPFVLLALFSVGVVVLFRRRWRVDRAAMRRAARLVEPDIATPPRDPAPRRRPWWGNPWLWVGVSAGFAVLGAVIWTPLLGGVFLFVPFVWISRPRSQEIDPRSNGHAKRDGPF